MAGIVQAPVPQTGVRQQPLPLRVVRPWIDRLPGRSREEPAAEGVVVGAGRPVASIRYVGQHAYRSEVTGYDAAGRVTGGKTTIPTVEGALAGVYEYSTTYTLTGDDSGSRVRVAVTASNAWGESSARRSLPTWFVERGVPHVCQAYASADAGSIASRLRVDGGMVASDWTMQRLSDLLDAPTAEWYDLVLEVGGEPEEWWTLARRGGKVKRTGMSNS